MNKGFFMLNQVWILNKTCLSKKYTSFFQKGCMLFRKSVQPIFRYVFN